MAETANGQIDPRWQRVQAQLRRWPVRLALGVLALLALVGIYAPFLASETLLAYRDPVAGWSFPLFAELFNRNVYPKFHELVFNLLGFVLPAALLFGWLRRWSWPRRIGVAVIASLGLSLLLLLPVLPRSVTRDDGSSATNWTAGWSKRPIATQTTAWWHDSMTKPSAVSSILGHSWIQTYAGQTRKPPLSVNERTGHRFVLGSDTTGRDVAAILIHGARISLTIGFVVTVISMGIGILIGVISGYVGGRTDLLLQRLVEIMMCFPTLILVIIVVAAFGRDIFLIMVVLGLTGWADTARLVRGEVIGQCGRDYVLACRSLGLGRWRIMLRHVLPNCLTPIIITAVFGIAGAVLGESSLSFIGLGDASSPSWGVLLNLGQENLRNAWLIYAPGISICLLVTSLYVVGNSLRAAFDPRAAR